MILSFNYQVGVHATEFDTPALAKSFGLKLHRMTFQTLRSTHLGWANGNFGSWAAKSCQANRNILRRRLGKAASQPEVTNHLVVPLWVSLTCQCRWTWNRNIDLLTIRRSRQNTPLAVFAPAYRRANRAQAKLSRSGRSRSFRSQCVHCRSSTG